jgi:putative flippase GtrA
LKSSSTGAGLVRFALVAGCGWLIDAACLVTFSRFAPAGLANVASSLIAAAFVYAVAHRYVHDGHPALVGVRLALYVCYTLVLIVGASFALVGVIGAIRAYVPQSAAIICAKVVITPPQFVCNFLMSRALARARLAG